MSTGLHLCHQPFKILSYSNKLYSNKLSNIIVYVIIAASGHLLWMEMPDPGLTEAGGSGRSGGARLVADPSLDGDA